jgi:hypothetical protein
MQFWADCITGTHVSSFWKRQGSTCSPKVASICTLADPIGCAHATVYTAGLDLSTIKRHLRFSLLARSLGGRRSPIEPVKGAGPV